MLFRVHITYTFLAYLALFQQLVQAQCNKLFILPKFEITFSILKNFYMYWSLFLGFLL